ncbi:glutamate formimidoyltransferase [Acanthopleuribacter pedis]|uniref:glutamate formimidoyltransferase n=1 Tax=Acanthopleuribacter pedis TaxID=442870 RepID=A0A8J7QIK0_9BACT|nr:glutamate formimidoyltransferase [Acanthopleuribacter pedis]MBO1318865.1 glutamate formimidoyltransferase [Acanthopleuribacter pedis]
MILECVPNFSEGRDLEKIKSIEDAIREVPGVLFLGSDIGRSVNRTVMTFAGPPAAVLEAAFRAVRRASEVIDMREHRGTHPRMGATDVCPLIPLQGIRAVEAVTLSRRLAQRIGRDLAVPTYLYGLAAESTDRVSLAEIRRGEYEGLAEKLTRPEFAPDFGPNRLTPNSGVTAVGVRRLMAAWNVNLKGNDQKAAAYIARRVRGAGRRHKGRFFPGPFPGLKAIGWTIEEFGCAQVSMNVMDLEAAPLWSVYREIQKLAEARGGGVAGSECIGLLPRGVLLQVADAVLKHMPGGDTATPEEKVALAVERIGLNSVKPFDTKRLILEEALGLSATLPLRFSLSG